MVEVTWAPGAVAADTDMDLPANSPPIGSVVSARVDELTEGTPNTLVETTPTPTKVDENTIQLDAAVTASSLLHLVYSQAGELVKP
jgi:hypothetical protein